MVSVPVVINDSFSIAFLGGPALVAKVFLFLNSIFSFFSEPPLYRFLAPKAVLIIDVFYRKFSEY